MKLWDLSTMLMPGGFALLALASGAVVFGQAEIRVPTVDGVCGRLMSVADVNDAVENDSKPLRKTPVRLYRQSPGSDCCTSLVKVAEVVTGRNGMFTFHLRNLERGLYWLSVSVEGREFNKLIRFEPPKGDAAPCADSTVEIDHAGHIALKALVTVD
jgi:hypothetical protein